MNEFSADVSSNYGDVTYGLRIDIPQVFGQQGQIREFARLKRALQMIFKAGVRAVDRVHAYRSVQRDRVLYPANVAILSGAGHCLGDAKQRSMVGDWRVGATGNYYSAVD